MDKNISKTLRQLEYGIYIVTMGTGPDGNAFTASWVTQVSSEPPMVALAVHNKHQSMPKLKEYGAFVVNILEEGQEAVAKTYYGPAESGYQKLQTTSITNAPETKTAVLSGANGFLDCRIVNTIPVGNHTLFIGEVVAAEPGKAKKILSKANSNLTYTG